MRIVVLAADGSAIWERDTQRNSGFASTDYLADGTQERIASALSEALAEAQGQMLRGGLPIADVVSDVCPTSANIDRYVPVSRAWDRDSCRKHLVEAAEISMLSAASEARKVGIVRQSHVALRVAVNDDDVAFF
jgi:hypothetical protein